MLGAPATQHPYAYGLNNPVRYSDPSGESPLLLIAAAAFLTGVIYDAALQYQENGWCGYNPVRAFLTGAMFSATAVSTVLTAVSIAYLGGLAIQGLGMGLGSVGLALPSGLAGLSHALLVIGFWTSGVGLSVSGAAAATSVWLWGGSVTPSVRSPRYLRDKTPVGSEWSYMGNNQRGAEFYGTEGPVNQYDIQEKVLEIREESPGTSINVLSGTHGKPGGWLERKPKFYWQDWRWVNRNELPNVQVYDIWKMKDSEVQSLSGTVVCAWCFSAQSKRIISILEGE